MYDDAKALFKKAMEARKKGYCRKAASLIEEAVEAYSKANRQLSKGGQEYAADAQEVMKLKIEAWNSIDNACIALPASKRQPRRAGRAPLDWDSRQAETKTEHEASSRRFARLDWDSRKAETKTENESRRFNLLDWDDKPSAETNLDNEASERRFKLLDWGK